MQDTQVCSKATVSVQIMFTPSRLSKTLYIGRHILKDDYAAMMAINYDLKAPDFSYLMITELKEFYYNKHNLLSDCKNIVIQMVPVLQQYNSALINKVQNIQNAVQ